MKVPKCRSIHDMTVGDSIGRRWSSIVVEILFIKYHDLYNPQASLVVFP